MRDRKGSTTTRYLDQELGHGYWRRAGAPGPDLDAPGKLIDRAAAVLRDAIRSHPDARRFRLWAARELIRRARRDRLYQPRGVRSHPEPIGPDPSA